jgi:hypothetical protein
MHKEKVEEFYKSVGKVYCPYFQKNVIFTSEGFHHLQFSGGIQRKPQEISLKLRLLKFAPKIIKNSGTIQEHRKTMYTIGKEKKSDGSREMKVVEFWGLVAICGENRNELRVKVILRKVGDGEIHFWSVMPMQRFGGDSYMRIASSTIDTE